MFGTINGGTTSNILCGRVEISGTVRTIKTETQDKIASQLEVLLRSITDIWGGSYEYTYSKGYPASWNDPELTDVLTNRSLQRLETNLLLSMNTRICAATISQSLQAKFLRSSCIGARVHLKRRTFLGITLTTV